MAFTLEASFCSSLPPLRRVLHDLMSCSALWHTHHGISKLTVTGKRVSCKTTKRLFAQRDQATRAPLVAHTPQLDDTNHVLFRLGHQMAPTLSSAATVPPEPNDMSSAPKAKCSFKKAMTIEPFMCGSEDKRSCRMELSQLFNLMICSYRKSGLSHLKLVSLSTGAIVQSIPPSNRFKAPVTNENRIGLLSIKERTIDKADESDYIITFTSQDMEGASDKSLQIITAHSTGLLKEWMVTCVERSNVTAEEEETTDESETLENHLQVTLKKTWASFHTGYMSCLVLAPKFSKHLHGLLATGGSSDSTIKIWDLKQGYCTHTFKLKCGSISTMSFHSYLSETGEARHVIVGSGDHSNQVQVFDLISGNKIGTLDGHISPVTSLQFVIEPEGPTELKGDEWTPNTLNRTLMVSLSRDKLMIVWSLKSMSPIKKIPVFDCIEDSCFLDDASPSPVILTVGDTGIIRAIDVMTGKVIFTQVSPSTDSEKITAIPLKQIAIWRREKKPCPTVISVTSGNQICFHKVNLKKKTLQLNHQLVGELDTVLCVKFIGPSSEHLIVASNSNLVKIYSLKDSSCQVLSPIRGQCHSDLVLSIATCPYDPYVFATCSKDNSVIIWRFWCREVKSCKTGETLRQEFGATALLCGAGHFRSVTTAAWPTKKSTGVMFTGSEDTIIKVWKIPSSLHKIEPNEQIDPLLVTISQLTSYSSVKAHDKDINCISVSPKDLFIATGSKDKTAKVWSLDPNKKSLSLVHTLRGHRKTVWFVDFSPVDKILLTASADSSLKMWCLRDYSCIRTLSIDNSSVFLVAKFISNGTQVLSASSNSLIRLWSARDICCELTLDPTVHDEVIAETTLAKYHADKSRAYGESLAPLDDDIDTRIWSIDLSASEAHFAFGVGSRVLLYSDSTSKSQSVLVQEKQARVVCDQKLSNLIKGKKYSKALAVAIQLNHPSRCLQIMREITLSSQEDAHSSPQSTGVDKLSTLLQQLRDDQLHFLLSNASNKWNTNSKNALIAQVVLKVALDRLITRLVESESGQADLTTLASAVTAALAYTERHVNRINRLYTSSHFVQFLCQRGMKALPSSGLEGG